MNLKLLVSIIIPCRNESRYITSFLESLKIQNFSFDQMEVLICDGESDDDTVDQIKKFQNNAPFEIKILNNPNRTVPFALNKMIDHASGKFVIRMDVHATYPSDYISKLVETIQRENCENIGGQVITNPSGESSVALSIAECSSHKFGVGNSQFRTLGDSSKQNIEVDTVPFGCFPKSLFNQIGVFDTDLTRNQDDEFNARIIKNGGKILLIPSLKIQYFARPNWVKMRAMFYQYGLFKPLTNKKLGKVSTLRQLVPPLFVAYIMLGWVPVVFWMYWWVVYSSGLVLYTLVNFYFSFKIGSSLSVKFLNVLTFFQIHWAYGWGYYNGILRFLILNRTTNKKIKQNS